MNPSDPCTKFVSCRATTHSDQLKTVVETCKSVFLVDSEREPESQDEDIGSKGDPEDFLSQWLRPGALGGFLSQEHLGSRIFLILPVH